MDIFGPGRGPSRPGRHFSWAGLTRPKLFRGRAESAQKYLGRAGPAQKKLGRLGPAQNFLGRFGLF